ncbi:MULTISPECIES: roadblock/LC7 domain-containing protein [Streptomyces]|jgi:predicted regulator of Ras-like GTPase activity (Roadblock/LC7/MglB family)|uniref:Roadblock/LC7 domain-containing protein n=1 Tax=Streptomyces thermoviolaceus subsp. thermoviolaceus TaxID=66860 RepID=A0ABX0YYL5_STRTL|nr:MULTISPECIES: roadblock/LC7 domain-containing protein [Streptomyces]MCE7552966.1 roadblock/LC7 domain-containing protein [Streptomyces thermodiastaticus]MCM3266074.1 roadblock/LC7 domain-containing protein [Streptomyces thermoviolaceus]NJP16281.1 roadblock/LC7 domain-containing protein [Streptomyces thermoviolaceus subsp. thermoviolaceus]RSS08170.1 roadblock/LC7 domain-containing protein [Streptomyces sp. WAC00469]WTD50547.1 roadblock/LC7 domain-containing protein [Streptomyces thermoviolac
MTEQVTTGRQLDWLLDGLVDRIPEIRCAIVLSGDGLLIGKSKDLLRDDAEHLSAVASGVHALARGAARHFHSGRVQQTVIQMDKAFLFVTAAGQGARLAAFASEEVDVGMMAYEMGTLVKQVGQYLTAAPRVQSPSGAPVQDA